MDGKELGKSFPLHPRVMNEWSGKTKTGVVHLSHLLRGRSSCLCFVHVKKQTRRE